MMFKITDVLNSNQKTELNVLGPNETRQEQNWKAAIKEAKSLLSQRDEIRFKIIALAEKYCSNIEGSKYTYNRFADEIGLSRNTLNEWIRVKNDVYNVIPKEDASFLSFSQMRNLNKRTSEFRPNTAEKGKAVLKALKQMKKENPDTIKFRGYLAKLNHLLYNVKDKYRTKQVDREVLAEMLHTSREIAKHLSWVDYEFKK